MPNPPHKPLNKDRRPRNFLYPDEIKALVEAARTSRNPVRDSVLIAIAFGHALQPVEIASLQWQHIHMTEKVAPATLTIYRNRRRGVYRQELIPDIHILSFAEVKLLRQLGQDYKGATILFPSERRHRLSPRSLHHIIERAGVKAGLEFPIHPYMVRTAGILYRAALLLSQMPEVTKRQCHLTWLKYGTFTSLSAQEQQEFESLDPSVVEAIWTTIDRMREFIGLNSYNHTVKYVLQVFTAYPNYERLPANFCLPPPSDWV
ncbi:tyrosine-type recombinase/integrase [Argonema antarcticum]|uniref:tyrosine-type recombinase/integrase n=1 Tax=Argonema antarcticum TaxID=2942763 RepID=UPI00201305C2|nr:tyrosine-type recombinase/integrase [Argonema antarcticum]MCL1476053.1 site-specific integrase [Argonema antarcticum A004/B2]